MGEVWRRMLRLVQLQMVVTISGLPLRYRLSMMENICSIAHTQRNITAGTAAEIAMIVFPSAILSWLVKLVEFERGTDPFRNVLLEAHICYTLPICVLITSALIGIAALLPAIKVFQYES